MRGAGTLFPSRYCEKTSFGELAQMYYSDHDYQGALRLFRREMHETRGMWQAMQAVGYRAKQKILSRSQVRTIVEFLGEP